VFVVFAVFGKEALFKFTGAFGGWMCSAYGYWGDQHARDHPQSTRLFAAAGLLSCACVECVRVAGVWLTCQQSLPLLSLLYTL
jgi:hypothetical protein